MTNEIDLINASIKGDKDSFGQIVRTYQSLICSITYNSIGDLHTSEDLAQETFFSAWKNLKSLKEKSKFKYWLCGIARNLTNDYIRTRYSDSTYKSQSLETYDNVPSLELNPRQEAISKEEENILWQSLKEIPELYREPLILYYRENQSIKMVAEALDISEDAVKQRLSRGRSMLKEQVTAFVENTLQKSKPSETFAIAVITALPSLLPQATAAGVALTASKGSVIFKSAISFLILGTVLTPTFGYIWGNMGALVGLLGAIFGATINIRYAKSSKERSFLIKMAMVHISLCVLYTLAIIGIVYWGNHHKTPMVNYIIQLTVIFIIGIVSSSIWTTRRVKKIQIEEGTYIDPSAWRKSAYQNFGKMSKGNIYGGFVGTVIGSTAWLIVMSIVNHDAPTALCIVLVSLVIYLFSVKYCIREPQRYFHIQIWTFWGIYLLTAGVIFFRWEPWHAVMYGAKYSSTRFIPTRWEIIGGITLLYLLMALGFHLMDKKMRRMSKSKV